MRGIRKESLLFIAVTVALVVAALILAMAFPSEGAPSGSSGGCLSYAPRVSTGGGMSVGLDGGIGLGGSGSAGMIDVGPTYKMSGCD